MNTTLHPIPNVVEVPVYNLPLDKESHVCVIV